MKKNSIALSIDWNTRKIYSSLETIGGQNQIISDTNVAFGYPSLMRPIANRCLRRKIYQIITKNGRWPWKYRGPKI